MAADPAQIACLVGIAPWKRERVRQILGSGLALPVTDNVESAIRMARSSGGAIAGWASRWPAGMVERAHGASVPLWTIEDGFIRSAGLGAALVQPCSLTLDSRGPHYDPAQPSDLEVMLQAGEFSAATLARAEALIDRLARTGLTKYNLAGSRPKLPPGRRIVLVLGQVDDDQSVLCGGAGQTVAGMIAAVRQQEPDAYIVYKPHPDVVAGLRRGTLKGQVDALAPDALLPALFAAADAVHVLTSLGGFEALLRGCRVVVHGQPFYAGWGLTEDRVALPRRTRKLRLAELVAGVLIDYPLYYHPLRQTRCSVEDLLDHLEQTGPSALPGALARWRGKAALWLAKRPPRPH